MRFPPPVRNLVVEFAKSDSRSVALHIEKRVSETLTITGT